MNARRPTAVFCPACGQEAAVYPGQTLIHSKCPKKDRGKEPPVYQEKKP